MATTLKVLGQSYPSATTLTTLYTVPSATSTVVSTIIICNQTATDTSFRIAIRPSGVGVANQHYIYYDTPILGNDTIALTAGITLATTDVISVYSAISGLSFNLYGQENS